MQHIQSRHIAAILKLTASNLKQFAPRQRSKKEYSEILVLRERIKVATDLKKARPQLLTPGLPRA
jgi:hypothetical protein